VVKTAAPQLYLDGYRSAEGAGVPLQRLDGLLAPALAENLRLGAGKPLQLRQHLARLAEGAHALGWPAPDLGALAAVARELPRRNRQAQGSLRLRYWGGLARPLLLAQTFRPRPLPASLRLVTSAERHHGPASLLARTKTNQMLQPAGPGRGPSLGRGRAAADP